MDAADAVADGHYHETHDIIDISGEHVTAASPNNQPNPPPQGHTAGSGNRNSNNGLQHHLPPPATDSNPEILQHAADSAADAHLSEDGHSFSNDDDDHSQPTADVFSNSFSGLQCAEDATYAAASGSSKIPSLVFSQTQAEHQIPAGLASRLSHKGHVHVSTMKPGSIAKQDIAARQLSEEELKLLLTL